MSDERLVPVFVRLYEHGKERSVPVGQAFVSSTEVVLSLEPIVLSLAEAARAETGEGQPLAAGVGPPRGRIADLERLAHRSRKVLADPRKSRWHGDVRAQLAEIEAELVRLRDRSPG
ncbi:MAG: hypothetical protein JNJ54_15420 [Myxococcaceae bacterium]|nr:hypothetical protein [Myxococcaceae bacterium]